MRQLRLKSHSPEQTQLLGHGIGELARRGDVVLLTGDLGTGKTCLAQGIARGLGLQEEPFSPSFVIIREYRGRLPLYHIDLYRLDDVREVAELGLEEYLYGQGVAIVEWAEKGLGVLPEKSMRVRLEYVTTGERERDITMEGEGRRHSELVRQVRRRVEKDLQWNSP